MAAPTTEYSIKLRNLHPAQQQIKDTARRYNVLCMGRRFGKTALGLDLLIDPVLLDGFPAAWFAPKFKYVKEVYREAVQTLQPLISKKDGTDYRIELVTGGVLEFWSMEDADAGRSRKYKRLIVDEAAMARHLETAWTQSMQATLMDYRGDAFFMSTPKGMVGPGKFFKELFEYGRPGSETRRKSWRSWQLPTASNPYIHPDEIEGMRLDMPELVFQQEVLAQFVDFGGTMVKSEWLHVGVPPALSTMRVYMACDLAISLKEEADYTTAAVIGVEPSGRIWILHVERARLSFFDAMKMIERVAMQWRPLEVGIESVQYQAAAVETLLRTTTLPIRAVKPDRDKLMRFQPVQVRYQHGLVWHAENLIPEWREELLSFPLSEHDDMVDAVAYAFMMAGEFGRSQIYIPEAPQAQEHKSVDVIRNLPGLPAHVAQQLADIQSSTEAASGQMPETCGNCSNFLERRCTARGFFVGPTDPGCDQFELVPQPDPEVGVEDTIAVLAE